MYKIGSFNCFNLGMGASKDIEEMNLTRKRVQKTCRNYK